MFGIINISTYLVRGEFRDDNKFQISREIFIDMKTSWINISKFLRT